MDKHSLRKNDMFIYKYKDGDGFEYHLLLKFVQTEARVLSGGDLCYICEVIFDFSNHKGDDRKTRRYTLEYGIQPVPELVRLIYG